MSKLIPIEYKNQRVLTTQQLAESYGTEPIKIQQNYSNNKERYIEGIHFFILEGEELGRLKNSLENFEVVGNRANRIFLWTERGAFYHAKSLGTDRAWDLYDNLVETYFKSQALIQYVKSEKLSPQTQLLLQLSHSTKSFILFIASLAVFSNVSLSPIA